MRKLSAILLSLTVLLSGAVPGRAQDEEDVMPYSPRASAPPGYPADYAAVVRAAEDEGQLVIYAATDASVAAPLIADFRSMYPRIEVTYEDLNTTVLYHRFVAERQLNADTADILWSSGMDQLAAVVSDGYAMTYESPERANLPAWANWKDQAFATTFEPVVFAYNKQLLQPAEVPQTHADMACLLSADPARFKGKVVAYDIQKSGVGFLLATQDAAASPEFWNIAKGLGQTDVQLELTTSVMVKKITSGEALIGYNVLGGYAIAQVKDNPSLGYVLPRDYTLVLSRVMLANGKAANPNAAKLWLDYMLSKRGQTVIANGSRLYAVRTDVQGETTAAQLEQTLGASQRPITAGPALIGYLNNQNYRDFILQWRQALTGQ